MTLYSAIGLKLFLHTRDFWCTLSALYNYIWFWINYWDMQSLRIYGASLRKQHIPTYICTYSNGILLMYFSFDLWFFALKNSFPGPIRGNFFTFLCCIYRGVGLITHDRHAFEKSHNSVFMQILLFWRTFSQKF